MAITSLDILNLSHSLKDICEVDCNTPECLSQALKILMQYNLIQANLQFGRQFGQICAPSAGPAAVPSAPARAVCPPPASTPEIPSPAPGATSAVPAPAGNAPSPKPPIRLDIADPFLAEHEK